MSTADRIAVAKNDIAYHAVLMTGAMARSIATSNGLSFEDLKPSEQKDVVDLAFAMSSGRWIVNGDAVVMAKDGIQLLDGRKRIMAAAHFDTCFPTLQVFGVDPVAATTIGEHRRRTASVVLRIAGHHSPSHLAAAAIAATGIAKAGHTGTGAIVQQSVVPLLIHDFPSIVDAVAAVQGTWLAKAAGTGVVAAVRFLAEGADPEQCEAFFADIEAVAEGGGSVLAKSLVDIVERTRDRNSYLSSTARRMRVRLLVAAWNAFLAGQSYDTLSFPEKLDEMVTMTGVSQDQFSAYYPDKDQKHVHDPEQVVALYQRLLRENSVTLAVKTIDPQWAEERLERNGPLIDGVRRNRSISRLTVVKLTRDMRTDHWQVNGQTIKFTKDWDLLDGQHRLKAIANSGVSIAALIAVGVDAEAFATFDLGRPRRFADILKAEGASSPNDLQGAARLVWQHMGPGLGSGTMPTNSELLDCWNEHRALADGLTLARDAQLSGLMPRSMGTAMQYLFGLEDEPAAKAFFEALASGENLKEGNPVLALRQRLIAMRAGLGLNSERIKLLVVVKAWIAWREGRSLDIVKARQNEKFPGIYGRKA